MNAIQKPLSFEYDLLINQQVEKTPSCFFMTWNKTISTYELRTYNTVKNLHIKNHNVIHTRIHVRTLYTKTTIKRIQNKIYTEIDFSTICDSRQGQISSLSPYLRIGIHIFIHCVILCFRIRVYVFWFWFYVLCYCLAAEYIFILKTKKKLWITC